MAAPIVDRRGATVGAIGISGAVERLKGDNGARSDLVSYVREAARAVSRDLGATRGDPGRKQPVSERFIASVDQGTASSRCLIFDRAARIVSVSQVEHEQHFPRPGHVEHDARRIWRNVQYVVADALAAAQLTVRDLAGLGITNQRETTVLWDRATGVPVHNAITGRTRAPTIWCVSWAAAEGVNRYPRPLRAAAGHVLLRRRRSAGCSTTSPACASAPRPARCCSGRWTPG